jgi:hypothetical protein
MSLRLLLLCRRLQSCPSTSRLRLYVHVNWFYVAWLPTSPFLASDWHFSEYPT